MNAVTLKKKEAESMLHDLMSEELVPLGFRWLKERSRTEKSWSRHVERRELTQSITPELSSHRASVVIVTFKAVVIDDALQALETTWTEDPRYKQMSPEIGAAPATLSSNGLKDVPGGALVSYFSREDFAQRRDQTRRIVRANVAWLERFSDNEELRRFLETASNEQLAAASIGRYRRDDLLLKIYWIRGDLDLLRSRANAILARPDEGNVSLRSVRALAAVALARVDAAR